MLNDKVLSMIGLAAKAGKVVSGEFMTEQKSKEGKAYLVIVALDASANTKKNFHDMCEFYKIPIMDYGSKESLGHAIGKELRASIAVLDAGFADSIIKKNVIISDSGNAGGNIDEHKN